jgi:hypothetical protein
MKSLRSRQFFSSSSSHSQNVNEINIKIGDIIEANFSGYKWVGMIVETNKYNFSHMAEVYWFHYGNCGTVNVFDCKIISS